MTKRLSEDVQFGGNTDSVAEASVELLDQLAAVLNAHRNVDGVVLQGHTNSLCGLDCDGSHECSNDTCHAAFGKTGGAVAFSLRRAEAVKAALVARGVQETRLKTMGLAGSRRIVMDSEAENNFLNRRVEIHLDDDDDDKEDVDQAPAIDDVVDQAPVEDVAPLVQAAIDEDDL